MPSLRADKINDHKQAAALTDASLDITGAEVVQIQTAEDRVWVNVNGVCVLRICNAKYIGADLKHKPTKRIEPSGSNHIHRLEK